MTQLSILASLIITKMINPIPLSFFVLSASILSSILLYKTTLSGWIPLITILTFSSGMMTLFMYAASLSPNETNKNKKTMIPLFILLLYLMSNNETTLKPQSYMKNFSSELLIISMAVILILTMLGISTHGNHPNQTLSTSF